MTLVFFYHTGLAISGGYVVTFFIVLSGFFSIYRYEYEESVSIKAMIDYAFNRIKKFYPVHFLMFMFSIPLVIDGYNGFSIVKRLIMVVVYNTFTQSLIPMSDYYFAFNPVEWTMSVLFISYILTPIMVAILQLFLNEKYKIFILISIIFAIELLYIFAFKNNQNYIWFCGVNPLFRMLDYFLGVACAFSWMRFDDKRVRNDEKYYSLLEILVVGFTIVIYFGVTPRLPAYYNWSLVWATLSIVVITVFKYEEGILSKFIFQNRVFVLFGKISFEFYIVHMLILNYVGLYIEGKWVHIMMSYIMTLLIAFLLHKYVTSIAQDKTGRLVEDIVKRREENGTSVCE